MNKYTPEAFALKLNSFSAEGRKANRKALEKSALVITTAARTYGRARVKKGKSFQNWWAHYASKDFNGDSAYASVKIVARGRWAYLADLGSYKKPGGFNTYGPSYSGTVMHPPISPQPWFYEGVNSVPDSVIGSAFGNEITSSLNTHF